MLAVLLLLVSTAVAASVPEKNNELQAVKLSMDNLKLEKGTEFTTIMMEIGDNLKIDTVQNSAIVSPVVAPAPTAIKVDFANKTAYANGIEYKIIEIKPVSAITRGSVPISGTVAGNQVNAHGSVYLTQGATITVAITHTPPYADVLLGFINSAGNGPGIIDSDHNGIASYSYQVPSSDSYWAIVAAPTSTGFSYSGYITF